VLHFNVTFIPRRIGRRSNFGRRSLSIKLRAICYAIATRALGTSSAGQVRDMKIKEVLSTRRSPWQRAYVERLIGSVRRECLDHVIVFHEAGLRRTLADFFVYFTRPALTCRWKRMRRSHGKCSRRSWAE